MKYVFRSRSKRALAALLDAVGHMLFWPARNTRAKKPFFGRVLIVRLDHLGDVLSASAVPKIIKEHHPECRLTFLASTLGAEMLAENPFVDEVLVYDAPWFAGKKRKKTAGFFETAKKLKERRFDVAMAPRGDLRENFLLFLAKAKQRIGYGVTGGGFFLTRELKHRRPVHETEHALDLLRALGMNAPALIPKIYLVPAETQAAAAKLSGLGLGGRWIGFQVDAGTSAKEWPVENAAAFFRSFRERHASYKFMLVGTDKVKAEKLLGLAADSRAQIVDLVGKTTIREFCALVRGASLFIGPDSGPAHIAAALGVPTLFIYSGTNDFEEWKPLAEQAAVLRHGVPCSPCALEDCPVPGHPCMEKIGPEEVLAAASRLLEVS